MNKIINHILRKKHIEYILLALLLLLGLTLRLYKIDNPVADWHSFRQADTASVSKMYVEEGINLLIPRYHDISTTQSGLFNPKGYRFVEFPVFNAIHAILANTFQSVNFDVIGRMVSVVSALVSACLIYLLGKRFLSWQSGIVASAFYLLAPYNVYFTRVILPEPLAVTLGLLGLWYFVEYIDREKSSFLLASSLFFSTAILVKPYMVFYGIPVVYLAVKKFGLKKALKSKELIFSTLVILLPFIFWRIWMRQFSEGIPFWKWTFNGDGIRFRPSFWKWIFGERLTKLILGYWGLVPFAFGLISSQKGNKFIRLYLLGMFLYVSVIATANVRHDYYQTIVIPAVSLVFASGVLFMWKLRKKLAGIRSILVFSIIIMFVSSVSDIKEFYKINHPEIIEAGSVVQRIVPKNSLIIAPYNGDTAFLYQTERSGWPVVDRPIDELIEKGAEYFVSVDLNHYQTVDFSERFKVIEKTDSYVIIKLK